MDLTFEKNTRMEQLSFIAKALRVTPLQLREAVIVADGGSSAELVNLSVKVPQTGSSKRQPLLPTSLLSRTAAVLGVDPRALQGAILASRPNAKPGQVVSLGVRLASDTTETTKVGAQKLEEAQAAADKGDRWAKEWLHLAEQLRSLARRL